MIKCSDLILDLAASFSQILGHPPHVNAGHMKEVLPLINRDAVLKILDAIIQDDKALREIANRSYRHTLGFEKIVILDPGITLENGSKGYGYQLRLHIWQPENGTSLPMLESMHEHSFDFISHLLTGGMENHCYTIEQLTDEDESLLATLNIHLGDMAMRDKIFVNHQIEILEALRLRELGSHQANHQGADSELNLERLSELVRISEWEIARIVSLQGQFQSAASGVTAGGYVHRHIKNVALKPHAVLLLQAGDTYFHPSPYAHRLYIPPGSPNSTIIITTPVSQAAMGGSFQRPTWVQGDHVDYQRTLYNPEQLRIMLSEYRARLLAEPIHLGHFFDVRQGVEPS